MNVATCGCPMKKSHTIVTIVDFAELVVERISNIVMIVTCVSMHNTFMITIARRENTCPIVQVCHYFRWCTHVCMLIHMYSWYC